MTVLCIYQKCLFQSSLFIWMATYFKQSFTAVFILHKWLITVLRWIYLELSLFFFFFLCPQPFIGISRSLHKFTYLSVWSDWIDLFSWSDWIDLLGWSDWIDLFGWDSSCLRWWDSSLANPSPLGGIMLTALLPLYSPAIRPSAACVGWEPGLQLAGFGLSILRNC